MKYYIEAVDDNGKITRVFLDERYGFLPGNNFTEEEAQEILESLLWEIDHHLGMDLHGLRDRCEREHRDHYSGRT